jgi:hypothetical protein
LAGLLTGLSTSASRKAAIKASNKPSMLILDFVGVSANLDLIGHDSFLDEEPEPTEPKEETKDITDEEFEETEELGFELGNVNLRALAAGTKSTTVHSFDEFDPFSASGSKYDRVELKGSLIGKEASLSHKQYRLLCKFGIDDETLSAKEAQRLVGFIAGKRFKLWAAEMGVLKKLYVEIKRER